MKIFESESKFNFVDENNVLVGFDSQSCCCENAGWYVSENKIPTAREINQASSHQLENESEWRFDPEFFSETSEVETDKKHTYNPLDSGGVATFRLVTNDGREKYLHLFNCQNGYYGHGFEMKSGSTELHSGSL